MPERPTNVPTGAVAIEIQAKQPRDLDPKDYKKLGLVKLVGKGFSLPGTAKDHMNRTKSIFGGTAAEKSILFAVSREQIVGALVVFSLPYTGFSLPGFEFWRHLNSAAELKEKALGYSTDALLIQGIVTDPSYRRQGIARRLYQHAFDMHKPSVVVGLSKSPEAVACRAQVLDHYGYQTFYGYHEVTPNALTGESQFHQPFISALFGTLNIKSESGILISASPLQAAPNVPQTENFPPNIQAAFADVVQQQQAVGERATTAKPLISVHRQVLGLTQPHSIWT